MEINRRDFVKLAGVGVVGLALGDIGAVSAKGERLWTANLVSA